MAAIACYERHGPPYNVVASPAVRLKLQAYAPTVENSVYVARDWRGCGVGHGVLEELVTLATAHGFHSIIARIVGGHVASIALHERCGFATIGIEREVGRKRKRA